MIAFFHTMPPIIVSLLTFLVAYISVILFAKFFGEGGIYVFIVLAIVGANIQVLKVIQFSFLSHPVALGTEFFAASYLATDILNEVYGKRAAKKGVFVGFAGMLFWTVAVLLTLSFRPIKGDEMHQAMKTIFSPAPIFLIASLISYLISQLNDVYLFSAIKKKTAGKKLWLRNNVSTLVSALLDNIVFSTLAFFIFPRFISGFDPVPFKTLIFTFILGTYLFRVFAAFFDTPFMYLAKKVLSNENSIENLSPL